MANEVLKVLMVDNAMLMCDFVHSVVAKIDGVSLIRANSYRMACDILATESVDLLLTEINLDTQACLGLELVGRLRSDEFEATAYSIPIIVCSSVALRSAVRDALLYDVSDFLIKPISADIVKSKLQYHLTRPNEVKQVAFYDRLHQYRLQQAEEKPKPNSGLKAWIVLSPTSDSEQTPFDDDESDDGVLYRMEEFIRWPDDTSTGNQAIDKHLKKLAFHVNGLYFAYKHNRRLIVLGKERDNVCQAVTFLVQVIGRNYVENHTDPLLQRLMQRLDKLEQINAELLAIDLVHHRKLARVLRAISQWWMATCSRQFMEKKPRRR
ncbi:response regulator [Shewanella sp. C32]|uniref:Response regulator n=1 Tax=Shewanella electrica TaxID=515560 RepID=A0ABT2FLZ4_9GAMM|nr:response regulator [Shewanella electrica]MCH1924330.1 response regulator [Shewanella electrica]MCS4556231.1 response regulator [Shewanella electrica]